MRGGGGGGEGGGFKGEKRCFGGGGGGGGGGGRWEDLRGTQSFQREWRRYYSLLENYKGGDYRQSPVNARGFIRTLQNLWGVRNQVNFIMTQPKPSRPPISPDDQ